MPVKLSIKTKSGKTVLKEQAYEDVQQIYKALIASNPSKYNEHRIRLTTEKKQVLSIKDSLPDLKDGDSLIFKDLGLQISWKTVFLIEYGGPILIHLLFILFPKFWYGVEVDTPFSSAPQFFGFILAQLHFLKRELETEYVHRFSNATMPWTNLPKNCFHYWILGGLAIAYPLYNPSYTPLFDITGNEAAVFLLVAVWVFAELSNYKTHAILRDLRPVGSTVRKIPRGYGFDLVSCPNYFFEIVGWIAYSILTGSWTSWFFTVAGAIQMYLWAVKKHQRYKKEFGKEYPKGRKVLVPFVL